MKLHGYCVKCRKFKRVRVLTVPAKGGVVMGTCDECEEKGR